ncbi:Alpha/Beta hydrolase protein [Xylariales sp. AK1849]|nr:Alpha/Beta hydrolase protein [Xylariales sp. AK1849]
MQDFEHLILHEAPPLDPAWLAHEKDVNLLAPKPAISVLERQPLYAAECRARNAAMMAPGARDFSLSQGILVEELSVESTVDGVAIPVLRYTLDQREGHGKVDVKDEERKEERQRMEEILILYIHGGSLCVGEADSEELTIRRILKYSLSLSDAHSITIYSPTYRLLPLSPSTAILQDVVDTFNYIQRLHLPSQNTTPKFILVGSSSGGELAALVSQKAPARSIHGVLLRCPVTVDAYSGIHLQYVPEQFRKWHTSTLHPSFQTSLLASLARAMPRDGLERMPLEYPGSPPTQPSAATNSSSSTDTRNLRSIALPRHWIQVCTNDVLYSDGVCYAQLLRDAGVEVRADVVVGFPHTFWLKAPGLKKALEADESVVRGLGWVLGGE